MLLNVLKGGVGSGAVLWFGGTGLHGVSAVIINGEGKRRDSYVRWE